MNSEEFRNFDGLGLAALVRRREIAARELCEVALREIDAGNPPLNAVVATVREEMERTLAAGVPAGPFHGVPFLIKDIGMHYAGVPCEMGSRLTRGFSLPYDTELAKRFKAAGFVTIGRTATPEFGCNATTESVAQGPTRNPWNRRKVAGGSSGGSAAAVAAGFVPVAHASDGGGSIRIPAACCGVFGLKPSRARIPVGPDTDDFIFGLGVEHVVSRTVRDSAAVLDAIAGPDVGARILLPSPERAFLEATRVAPPKLRIGFSTTSLDGGPAVHEECQAAVRAAARLCERLGHDVFEARPEVRHEEAGRIFLSLAGATIAEWSRQLAAATGRPVNAETVEPTTRAVIEYGTAMSAIDLVNALAEANSVSRRLGALFGGIDLWLTPVLSTPPIDLGVLNANDPRLSAEEWIRAIFNFGAFTAPFNVSGQPAMSVPLYWTTDGLPIGVQFAARLGDEALLLQLAAQLEESCPWRDRRPGLTT